MLPIINGVATLGKDIELSYLPDGTPIGKMSLAFSDKVKKKGEWVDETLWLNATHFGKQAEYVAGNTSKGELIEVRGTLRSNDWVDKEGKKHYDMSLMLENVRLLTKKPKQDKPQSAPKKEAFEVDDDNLEIPF